MALILTRNWKHAEEGKQAAKKKEVLKIGNPGLGGIQNPTMIPNRNSKAPMAYTWSQQKQETESPKTNKAQFIISLQPNYPNCCNQCYYTMFSSYRLII